jgi:hypothetical protein
MAPYWPARPGWPSPAASPASGATGAGSQPRDLPDRHGVHHQCGQARPGQHAGHFHALWLFRPAPGNPRRWRRHCAGSAGRTRYSRPLRTSRPVRARRWLHANLDIASAGSAGTCITARAGQVAYQRTSFIPFR